jgi:hypothetical protein
MEKLD